MTVPSDVAALARAGHLEEVEPGLYRRPRLPARSELYAQPQPQPPTIERTTSMSTDPRSEEIA